MNKNVIKSIIEGVLFGIIGGIATSLPWLFFWYIYQSDMQYSNTMLSFWWIYILLIPGFVFMYTVIPFIRQLCIKEKVILTLLFNFSFLINIISTLVAGVTIIVTIWIILWLVLNIRLSLKHSVIGVALNIAYMAVIIPFSLSLLMSNDVLGVILISLILWFVIMGIFFRIILPEYYLKAQLYKK